MFRKLLIYSFGGNGKETLLTILAVNKTEPQWEVVGFIDDDESTWGEEVYGVKVLGGRDVLEEHSEAYVVVVMGNPDNYSERQQIIADFNIDEFRYAQIIHPSAEVAPDAKLGFNIVIMAHVFISANSTIGNHCIILPGTVISHDTTIGDYTCIGSNVALCGHVHIGKSCYIGTGATVRNNLKIEEGSLVGIGANVVADITAGSVVVGNPAKPMQRK